MKVHDWLDTVLARKGEDFACFDVRGYVGTFKSNTEYYASATDPRVFLTAIALRQPDAALTVLGHLLATARMSALPRSIRLAIQAAIDPKATKNMLLYHLHRVDEAAETSPPRTLARHLLRWRTGQTSGRVIWFVVQTLVPDKSDYPSLMRIIRSLIPLKTWEASITESTAENSRL